MSNVVHYYYPSPTLHHHPKNGRIKIGNILTDFKKPEDFKSRGPAIPPPDTDLKTEIVKDVIEYGGVKEVVATSADATSSTGKTPEQSEPDLPNETTISLQNTAEFSTKHLRAGKVGVWAKVSSIGGASVGLEWTKEHDEVFNFETVVTVEFWPNESYVTKCVSSTKIKNILQLTNYKPLYLITGIKTVMGAKAKTEDSASRDVNTSMEIDATGPSGGTVPVKVEPRLELKKEEKMGMSFESSSDFVFAFRIKKIVVNKKTQAEHAEDVTKGALLGQNEALTSLPYSVIAVVDAGPEVLEYVGYDNATEGEEVEDDATSGVKVDA